METVTIPSINFGIPSPKTLKLQRKNKKNKKKKMDVVSIQI